MQLWFSGRIRASQTNGNSSGCEFDSRKLHFKMIKEKSCGAIVFRRDMEIKYLLMHKPDSKGFHGYWGFVKGQVEEGEEEKDTVIRELKEETGIIEANFIEDFKDEVNFFFKINNKLISKKIKYYLLQVRVKGIKISMEHDDYIWCNYDEAIIKLKFKSDKEILKRASLFLAKK